jgi:hypothetical protein
VSLSKDAIIAVNEYLQILNLELNKLGDEVSTNIEHNINKKIENTNDVDAISKVLLEMNIAHSIASS